MLPETIVYINKILNEKHDELYQKYWECEKDKNCNEDLLQEIDDHLYEVIQALVDFQKHNFNWLKGMIFLEKLILPESDLRYRTPLPNVKIVMTEREIYEKLKSQQPSILDKVKKFIERNESFESKFGFTKYTS